MAPVLEFFQESGPLTGARGTTVTEVDNWNMKDSAGVLTLYYPHDGADSAPLTRPTLAGDLKLSFKVYTFFKISGTYSKIKNLKLNLSLDDASEASGAMLYYKTTNTYATPDAAFDGSMIPVWTGSAWAAGGSGLTIWPNWSTVGPQAATSRSTVYGPNATLFSGWLVTQLRIQNSTSNTAVGNTAEFKLRLSFTEFV